MSRRPGLWGGRPRSTWHPGEPPRRRPAWVKRSRSCVGRQVRCWTAKGWSRAGTSLPRRQRTVTLQSGRRILQGRRRTTRASSRIAVSVSVKGRSSPSRTARTDRASATLAPPLADVPAGLPPTGRVSTEQCLPQRTDPGDPPVRPPNSRNHEPSTRLVSTAGVDSVSRSRTRRLPRAAEQSRSHRAGPGL